MSEEQKSIKSVFEGHNLIKRDGSPVDAQKAVDDAKLVLCYFSAHWCPPCLRFTTTLKEFYTKAKDSGVLIIFVSSDRTEAEMTSHFNEHGDYLSVPFSSFVLRRSLKDSCQAHGLPCLCLIDKNGQMLYNNGRDVTGKTVEEACALWTNKLSCSKDMKSVFEGHNLIKRDGSRLDAQKAVDDAKLVLCYFSAHWCPPCRRFTTTLNEFYTKAKDSGVLIIFVSSDRTEAEMTSSFNDQGDHLAVPFGSSVLRKSLKDNCQVSGLPRLCLIDKDGQMLYNNGRGDVTGKTVEEACVLWTKKLSCSTNVN